MPFSAPSARPHPLTGVALAVLLALLATSCGGGAEEGAEAEPPADEPAATADGAEPATEVETAAPATEAAPAEGEMRTIRVGIVGASAVDWPLLTMQNQEMCAEHGVEIERIDTGSSAAIAQQLAAGSIDVGSGGWPDLIRAIDAGAPLRIVASGVRAPYSVMADSSIGSWQDLAGETVIIGGENDITRMYFNVLAEANGLDPSEVQLTYAGSTPNRFAALESGSVAAAILAPPFDVRATSLGATNLGTVYEHLPEAPFIGYAADPTWAAENEQLLVDFLTCYVQAIQWLRDPANAEAAVQVLAEMTNTEPADAQATYDYYFEEIEAFPEDAMTSEEGYQSLVDGLTEYGLLEGGVQPMDTYVDYSYLEAAAGDA